MDLHKVTKASISTENASPAAFLHAVDICFFSFIYVFSHYYEQHQDSLIAVTQVISEHITMVTSPEPPVASLLCMDMEAMNLSSVFTHSPHGHP